MRDGPARCAAHHAKPGLPIDSVYLVDDAVNIVGQGRAHRGDLVIERDCIVAAGAHSGERVDGEPPILEM